MPRSVSALARILPLLLTLVLLSSSIPALAAAPTVEIYVTSWCPYCKKATAYFQAKGIAATALDVEKDPAAARRFQQYGGRGVPLVVINGQVIAGYAVEEYERALAGGN